MTLRKWSMGSRHYETTYRPHLQGSMCPRTADPSWWGQNIASKHQDPFTHWRRVSGHLCNMPKRLDDITYNKLTYVHSTQFKPYYNLSIASSIPGGKDNRSTRLTSYFNIARFEVLTAIVIKILVFGDITPSTFDRVSRVMWLVFSLRCDLKEWNLVLND